MHATGTAASALDAAVGREAPVFALAVGAEEVLANAVELLTDAATACEFVGVGEAEYVADPNALRAAVGAALALAAEPEPSLQATRPQQAASASAAVTAARP
ncbi:hypothetical protein [Streptomyces sp. NPDC056192]|uniref:hypothetical protein n=1 Tax=Streptomyces sp. NPDC056192 TaxID=3345743 RepID=UPI0035DF0A4A